MKRVYFRNEDQPIVAGHTITDAAPLWAGAHATYEEGFVVRWRGESYWRNSVYPGLPTKAPGESECWTQHQRLTAPDYKGFFWQDDEKLHFTVEKVENDGWLQVTFEDGRTARMIWSENDKDWYIEHISQRRR